jgi:hypothetical protein
MKAIYAGGGVNRLRVPEIGVFPFDVYTSAKYVFALRMGVFILRGNSGDEVFTIDGVVVKIFIVRKSCS